MDYLQLSINIFLVIAGSILAISPSFLQKLSAKKQSVFFLISGIILITLGIINAIFESENSYKLLKNIQDVSSSSLQLQTQIDWDDIKPIFTFGYQGNTPLVIKPGDFECLLMITPSSSLPNFIPKDRVGKVLLNSTMQDSFGINLRVLSAENAVEILQFFMKSHKKEFAKDLNAGVSSPFEQKNKIFIVNYSSKEAVYTPGLVSQEIEFSNTGFQLGDLPYSSLTQLNDTFITIFIRSNIGEPIQYFYSTIIIPTKTGNFVLNGSFDKSLSSRDDLRSNILTFYIPPDTFTSTNDN